MTNKSISSFIAGGIIFFGVCVGTLFSVVNAKKPVEANALTLPTSIDLNDTSEANIRSYYSYLNTLSDDERRGTNLLKNLKHILLTNPSNSSKPAQYFTYTQVRSIYRITDRQWTASPANAISGYDSSTNTITGFSGYSDAPYLYYYYRSDNYSNPHTATATVTSSTGSSQTLLNQEHLWSKSHGFAGTGSGDPNAGSDLHHLVAGDVAVNKWAHSNYSYGNVGTENSSWVTTRTNWDNGANAILGNKMGTVATSRTGDEDTTVFEPQDTDKGDIARALLYMVARYNYNGLDATTASLTEPNLELVNYVISGSTTQTCDGTNGAAKYGVLSDLLEWHKNDPVTTATDTGNYEVHRNNLIYNNYQYNRNPFIDFPEWVDYIWGDKATTGVASPATDTVYGYNSASNPTAITLNATSADVSVGNSYQASVASVTPSDASKSVTWASSNTGVATVTASGSIVGVSAGSAVITATSTVDTSVSASMSVNVSNVSLTGIALNKTSTSIEVGASETLSVTYTPSNASNKNVTWSSSNSSVASVSGGDVVGISEGSSVITATSADGGYTSSCTVTVTAATTPTASYQKISALTDLTTGNYVIAAYSNSNYYAMSNTFPTSAGSVSSTVVTVADNKITTSDVSAYVVTLTVSGTSVTIASGSNYIKYYGSSSTSLVSTTTAYNWTVSVPGTSYGTFHFVETTGNSRFLGFSTNTNYLYYKCYASASSSYFNVELFKYVESSTYTKTTFANDMLNHITCDATGQTAPTFASGYSWAELKVKYNSLSSADQTSIKNAVANETSSDVVEKAMYRYDYIVGKYLVGQGLTQYDDFIGREPSAVGLIHVTPFGNSDDGTVIGIIVIVAITSLSAVGGYFFIRRRKES